jgi:hypothetical protein
MTSIADKSDFQLAAWQLTPQFACHSSFSFAL